MKLFAFIVVFCLLQFKAFTQPYPSGRIRINSGSRVNFDFNTFEKLKNGIKKTDFTEIEIDYVDKDSFITLKGWELLVNASTSTIDPTYNATSGLPIGIIELEASFVAPRVGVIKIPLSTTNTLIADGEWNPVIPINTENSENAKIKITYYCNQGITKVNFSNYIDDTYVVELQITLRRKM